jgi:allantoinase
MIFKNTSGGPGIETLLPALWTGCEEWPVADHRGEAALEGPAKAFLLADKGRLEAGADADITVLEPGRFIHDPSRASRREVELDGGPRVPRRVAATYVRGQLAWDGKEIRNKAGDGRFLAPGGVSAMSIDQDRLLAPHRGALESPTRSGLGRAAPSRRAFSKGANG